MNTENKAYFQHITRRMLYVLVLVFLFTAAKDWRQGVKDGWNSESASAARPKGQQKRKTHQSQIRLAFPLLITY